MVNATLTPEHNIATTTEDGTEYIYSTGDIAWMLASTALVMSMMPTGLGFFYAGLCRRKNALTQLFLAFSVFAIASLGWVLMGYSLSFSSSGPTFIGDLSNGALVGVDLQPSIGGSAVPALLYALYQMMFAGTTLVILCGAFADRARLLPVLVFAFCWLLIVYSPIARSIWAVGKGWGNVLGGLDYAGGGPVHESSGVAALAVSIFLGKRRGYGTDQLAYRPNNVGFVILGTAFLWFGWFGFNGGSGLGANLRAVQAMVVTNTAAAAGGLTWLLLDYRIERKLSAVGFCSGAIAGLVAITPASGYVGTPASFAFGVLGGLACNFATSLKTLLPGGGVDDALDIFAAHGVGGIVGTLLTAIFADHRVASFDGSVPIAGGWINGNWIQMAYQLADVAFICGWSFVVTMILLFGIDRIPGLHFRASEQEEILGTDLALIGEEVMWLGMGSSALGGGGGDEWTHHEQQQRRHEQAESPIPQKLEHEHESTSSQGHGHAHGGKAAEAMA